MIVVHLTASTFYGGPERQMLGLADHLAADCHSHFLSFSEHHRCGPFLEQAARRGHRVQALQHDTPHLLAASHEIAQILTTVQADLLCCHGYKADVLGRWAARRVGIPVIAVSRGWTSENLKVRFYEYLDRLNLRSMDRVVCVSEGQARKVRAAGVSPERIVVIRNAIDTSRFGPPQPAQRAELRALFPRPPRWIIGAAGRLSPEKGFAVLLEAARELCATDDSLGFVHFGEGPLRESMRQQIAAARLTDRFILAGLRDQLDALYPCFDLLVLPSFTEGLPNVVLEACGAGVPVVATAVGGTPEIVRDGINGYLVPPGNPLALATRIADALRCPATRQAMGERGRQLVQHEFTFHAQALLYRNLFRELCRPATVAAVPPLTGKLLRKHPA